MKSILCLILFLSSQAVMAAEYNELKIGTRLNLDSNIRTVKDAVEWLLRPTDYKLLLSYPAPIDARLIAESPISPLVQNDVSMVVPIDEAILFVLGGDRLLVVDHKNKLITFENNHD